MCLENKKPYLSICIENRWKAINHVNLFSATCKGMTSLLDIMVYLYCTGYSFSECIFFYQQAKNCKEILPNSIDMQNFDAIFLILLIKNISWNQMTCMYIEIKHVRPYMDFLIDGQISSFCPGQHEAALLTLIMSHKLTQSL